MDIVDELMVGAVDLHVHSHMANGWRWHLLEWANKASEAQMSGIVLKNRYGSSSDIAYLINQLAGKNVLIGSIVLNRWIGGLNPFAVREFIKIGTGIRMVHLPTGHSVNHQTKLRGGKPDSAVRLFNGSQVVPELKEILEIVAEHDIILATGHIAPEESLAIIEAARKVGVRKIVVTHASALPVLASVKQQKEMRDQGAVIEQCIAACMPLAVMMLKNRFSSDAECTLKSMIEDIMEIGIEHCVVSTDLGQDYNPDPIEGMKMFIHGLLEFGLTAAQVKTLVETNPKRLLATEKNTSGGQERAHGGSRL